MKKMKLTISAVALCALISGCQNTVNTAENQNKVMKPNYINSQYVSTDSFVKNRLKIDGINKSTLPSGLMMIQVNFRSDRTGFFSEMWSGITGENPYKVEYKIDWLDKDGMEVSTPASIWKEIEFIPGETKRIQAVAPNQRCKDFVINMKEYGK